MNSAQSNTRSGNLPDFVIIGGMKCGTTSLFQYLGEHPELAPCNNKEPSFFSKKNWHKGVEWYQTLFPQTGRLKFEASTDYSKYPNFDHVPQRMSEVIPGARLIYIVRHPVDRVTSELVHNVRAGRLRYSALTKPEFWPKGAQFSINCSKYYWQIEQYLPYFDKDRFCVITLEELANDTRQTLEQVLEFLGLAKGFYQDVITYRKYNTASRKSLRGYWRRLRTPQQLKNFTLTYKQQRWIWDACVDDLRKLEEFIGRPLNYSAPRES